MQIKGIKRAIKGLSLDGYNIPSAQIYLPTDHNRVMFSMRAH